MSLWYTITIVLSHVFPPKNTFLGRSQVKFGDDSGNEGMWIVMFRPSSIEAIRLMEEILDNQLRLVVYPIIYRVVYFPGG